MKVSLQEHKWPSHSHRRGKTGEITLKISSKVTEVLEYTRVLPVNILNAYNHDKQFTLSASEALEDKSGNSNRQSNGPSYNLHRLEERPLKMNGLF